MMMEPAKVGASDKIEQVTRSAQGRTAGASNVTSTVAGTFLQTFQFFCQQFGIQNTAGMPWSQVSAAKVATMNWRPANVQPLTFAVH